MTIMLKEIILIVFIFNGVKTQCIPLDYDTHCQFSIPDYHFLCTIPEFDGGMFLNNNNFEGDSITITETPIFICFDLISDIFSSPIQEMDLKRCEDYPNTFILTITESLLIDLPDSYNGVFGCDSETKFDMKHQPATSMFDSSTIPILPSCLGTGKYLRQVTIQPPFF